MKLRVTFKPDDGAASVNLQVTADATTTAGDLARALAKGPSAAGPVPEPERLGLALTDQTGRRRIVHPRQPVISSGLVSGSVIELVRVAQWASERGEPVATLRVMAGPDAGVEVRLPAGVSLVGRAPDCDVRLNDPRVSKHHARIDIRDSVEIADLNSSNGVVVGGVRMPRVSVGPADGVLLGDTTLMIQPTRELADPARATTDIAFMRSPRVLSRRTREKVRLPQPPQDPEGSRFPWLAMVAPLIMGGIMFASTGNPISLAFVALSPILMVGNWLAQRADMKRKRTEASAEFHRSLGQSATRLAALHDLERRQLESVHPSVTDCVSHIDRLGSVLWSRRPEHPEFLQVRLGKGTVVPLATVEPPTSGGRAEFAEPLATVAAQFARLTDAPVVADLRSVGGVGISGPEGLAEGVARAAMVQLVALHAPSEVVLACLTSAAGRARWLWVEWLPHTSSPQSPLGGVQLAADPGTGRVLVERLEELVALRGGHEGGSLRGPTAPDKEGPEPVLPSVVVIVDEPADDLVGRLTRLAERGPDVGVYLMWVARTRRAIPAACRTYLDLGDGTNAKVGQVRTGELVTPVACESVDAGTAMRLARRLAPVVDIGAPAEDESDLPRSVSVVSLLGRDIADEPDQVLVRWKENGSWVNRALPGSPRERAGDLRAIVGHTGIDPFTLDLRSQGPHALVGGTTGSGKSEFLQAWVLGLAHAYSPDRVTFLFVDYKGGAAFSMCEKLPHNVGMVTDLSPYLVRRALRSLRAEIRHREHLLHEKGVKDLIDFELTGDPECPPSLIIVVDEFAALKSEVPDFYEGVVDVAQRGRSLGLHLIMATQRPTGVITDSLRANTNLRVALRMNDDHDSADVLGDKMAARFDPSIPGRGAARTGPGRIVQFQAAYPGARTSEEPSAPPIEIVELDFGLGRPWKIATPDQSGPRPDKDIERVVRSVTGAAALGRVPAPRRPWLDTLAHAYNLEKLGQRSDSELVLGVMDDPDHQAQVKQSFHPDDDGNILFVGSGGSGKTTALRTLAIAAGFVARGGPVHVYGLDFGGGGLALLEPLPYVGSVVQGDDEERVSRLIRLVSGMIEDREARYKQAGQAASLPEYRRNSGSADEPRVLLLVDAFQNFRAEYDASVQRSSVYNAFQKILSQGRAVGIHVAMSVDRTPSVPNALSATFQKKVILRQTDEDGYLMSGVPKDVLTPSSPPGRGMLVDNPQELQLAILGDDGTPGAQSLLVEEIARDLGPYYTRVPEPIRSLPLNILGSSMPSSVDELPVLGVEDISLAPVGFNPRGPVIVAGGAQSGRTTAMRWLAEAIRQWSPETALVHFSARPSTLGSLPLWAASMIGPANAQPYLVEKLKPYLERASDGKPAVAVFVEYFPEYAASVAETALTEAVQLARRNGHPFFVDGEPSGFGGFQGLLSEVRQARTGLVLMPDQNDGDNLFRTPFPRVRRADFPPGRGLWTRAGKVFKVQIPMPG